MNLKPSDVLSMQKPDPSDTRALRDAFSRFATGVTVITAQVGGQSVAITANSFTSVSLDPPLVLWCLGQDSNRYDAFIAAERYSIHVLSADQRDLCDLFARDGSALSQVAHDTTEDGTPVLRGCLARFDCLKRAVHPAGDHQLIIGEVLASGYRSGAALGFFDGELGSYPA